MPKRKRKSSPGSRNAAGPSARRSITNCAIGFFRGNVTGANHFRLFGSDGKTSRVRRKRAARRAAAAGRLQTDRHRRTAAGKSEGLDSLLGQGDARNERDAAMGGLVLVLPALLRSAKRRALRRRRSGTILDGRAIMPGGVDLYVGGTEHAVLHLLYARFWHKVFVRSRLLSKPEPFQRLVNQGMILGEDNQKMSKSRGNMVESRRRDRPIRRGRVSLLRNVHGPAGADETVEHARRRRRFAISGARLAIDDDGKSGGRMAIVRRAARCRSDQGAAERSPTRRSRK